jgi:hypothetical protein
MRARAKAIKSVASPAVSLPPFDDAQGRADAASRKALNVGLKSRPNPKGKYHCRFPSGMTTRKVKARAVAWRAYVIPTIAKSAMDGGTRGLVAGEHSTAKNVAGEQAKSANNSANFIFDSLVILPMVGQTARGYSPGHRARSSIGRRSFEAMLSG